MRVLIVTIFISLFACNGNVQHGDIEFPKGGYELPKQLDKDSSFCFYPIKSIESSHDSFHDAFYTNLLLRAFNEPNNSIKSLPEPTIRLIYQCYTCQAYIISLTPTHIVVKKGNRVNVISQNDSMLSEIEKAHIKILESYYPINSGIQVISKSKRQYLDSMVKLYPQLLDSSYFKQLINKIYIPTEEPFTYTTSTYPISKTKYLKFISTLNESGYWKAPIRLECKNSPNDAANFMLEVNTGSQYNIVKFVSCEDSASKIRMVCSDLARLARLENVLNW